MPDRTWPEASPTLIDEYQLYFRPVVLGRGTPFFAGPRPPLRLVANELVGEDAVRLTYVPGLIARRACRRNRQGGAVADAEQSGSDTAGPKTLQVVDFAKD